MELQQLKYFQVVAKHEHMTRAAEELHISQPSLSITISRLEETIGVPLFDRIGRKIKLNAYGKVLLHRLEGAFLEVDEGIREISDLAGLERGTVSVATTNLGLLTDLLQSFLSTYPKMKFRLFQDTTIRMQQQLENGDVDFCLSSPLIQGKEIKGDPLLTEEIVLVVPITHHLSSYDEIPLRKAAEESFISLKAGYGLRDTMDDLCRQAGFTPDVTFEVNDPSLIGSLVKTGNAIAFMPLHAWNRQKNPQTKAIRIKEPICQRVIGLSWLENRYLSTAAQQFHTYVTHFFEQLDN